MEYDNDITLVTMFFDINRDNWELSNSVRKTNTYLNAFYHFLDYPYNMVCFIDNRYYNEVIEKYNESKYKNKVFISIDKQWLTEHTLAWKQVGVDEIIMKSILIIQKILDKNLGKYINGKMFVCIGIIFLTI